MIKKDPAAIKLEEKEPFRSIFLPQGDDENKARYEDLITLMMNQLISTEETLFIEDIKNEKHHFHLDADFNKACRYIESVPVADLNNIAPDKIDNYCVMVERHLTKLLIKVLFLSKYRLASVKNIYVKKQRHFLNPLFLHTTVELEHDILNFDESIEALEHVMDDSSVILCHSIDSAPTNSSNGVATYLNLSPFIFDENAINIGAPIPEILYLDHYKPATNDVIYYPIYKKTKPVFKLNDNNEFSNIKSQLDEFCRLIFDQPLEEAL